MSEIGTVKGRLIAFISYLGVGQGKFEKECGLANGYVNNIRKSVTPEKLQQIALHYPELNTGWLMTGEGDMLKPSQKIGDITNSSVAGVNVSGRDIHINPNAYETLLKIVETNQKATDKFQEQIDRLISIIEVKYGTNHR